LEHEMKCFYASVEFCYYWMYYFILFFSKIQFVQKMYVYID